MWMSFHGGRRFFIHKSTPFFFHLNILNSIICYYSSHHLDILPFLPWYSWKGGGRRNTSKSSAKEKAPFSPKNKKKICSPLWLLSIHSISIISHATSVENVLRRNGRCFSVTIPIPHSIYFFPTTPKGIPPTPQQSDNALTATLRPAQKADVLPQTLNNSDIYIVPCVTGKKGWKYPINSTISRYMMYR